MQKIFLLLCSFVLVRASAQKDSIPNTGISGVYEVLYATNEPAYMIRYFNEFGFRVVDSAKLSANEAKALYGVPSALQSYRLQNGQVDAHGLLRILVWEKPLGPGVGMVEPESIGQRLAVMMTKDIVRLTDVFKLLRDQQQQWLPTEPIFDDPLRINKNGELDFFKRPIGVRENAVYGARFNHVFFQRYGYVIPGYGTIDPATPLQTSEFTHHDFMIRIDSMQQLMYLQTALGLKAEKAPEIDGDWLKGPRATFLMAPGSSHWYQGFISPNNICGKLKFFMPRGPKPDHSTRQKPGEMGITLHSFYTPKLVYVHSLVQKHGLHPTPIQKNEFGENSFVFRGPEGASWQIIEKFQVRNLPATQSSLQLIQQ